MPYSAMRTDVANLVCGVASTEMVYYAMSPNLNLANVEETDGEALVKALAAGA